MKNKPLSLLPFALWLSLSGCSSRKGPSPEVPQGLRVGNPGSATWSAPIPMPIVPVAAAGLPDGKVLLWSSFSRTNWNGSGSTYTALFDPATLGVTETLVTVTGHDMFCPGTTNLADGRILVNGGSDGAKTSIYDGATGTWTTGPLMNIVRGYQGNTILWDGTVFTLGGSFSGTTGNKHAELWNEATGWRQLSNVPINTVITADDAGTYRSDNHVWLLPTANGRVLQAGPSKQMNWITTAGEGSISAAGLRSDDTDSMCGSAVMYDVGKILKVGGSPSYQNSNANANAYVIDTTLGSATTRKLAPMAYARAYHTSVVLPNGQVVIVGGQTVPTPGSDGGSVLVPELWDPSSETFSALTPMTVPRNYHSIAILLMDGTVMAAGGGLCGTCTANHLDAQILTPPYLLNQDGTAAPRPVITAAPARVGHGSSAAVTTSVPVAAFSLVRMSSVTHSLNNDQRRLPLSFTSTGPNTYALAIPANPGIALPGAYMLFALDATGVPSVARVVVVGTDETPKLQPVADQASTGGVAASLGLVATAPGSQGAVVYAATGLPAGLTLNGTTGVISGTPTTAGTSLVTVSASNQAGMGRTEFLWSVNGGGPVNRPPVVAAIPAQSSARDAAVSLATSASDPDGDALTHVALGLPPGLVISVDTGLISGAATNEGIFLVTVEVTDSRGAMASVSFDWTITSTGPAVAAVVAPPAVVGTTVSYTADAQGTALEYAWNFGDGTGPGAFSAAPEASHVYASPGLFAATLTVRASDGQITVRSFVQAITTAPLPGRASTSSNVVLESASGNGGRLWVVNADNNSVTVFNAATNIKLAEIAVGTFPAAVAVAGDGNVWVTNRESATISVIAASSLTVTTTIALPRASSPYGIVFSPADGAAFVSLGALGRVVKVDPSGTIVNSLAVGPNPRGLAVDATGARLLVSRFITPPLPGEGTATVQPSPAVGGEVIIVNAQTFTVQTIVPLRHSDKQDSETQGRGLPNYLGAAAISPDGAAAWIPSKQDNIMRGKLRDGLDLDFQNTVRAVSSRIDLATSAEDHPARVDHDNAGVATAAAYHPSGAYVFVALETSREVAVIDPVGQREYLRFETGRAPAGLVVSPDGLQLYVNNVMDRSVNVFDLVPLVNLGQARIPLGATLSAVALERLTATVLRGKQLFHDADDPRLARDGYLSCATCHHDGEEDGRVWDLTGMGEGLRNTISLRGRGGAQGPLHWTGNFDEVQDFEGQIRTLSRGTGLMTDAQFNTGTRNTALGDSKTGISADLDALAAYVSSLTISAPSPHRDPSGALLGDAVAGKGLFGTRCATCHGGVAFTLSALGNLRDVGTIKPSSGKRLGATLFGIDIPTLRDAWATAPYLHDGSATTLADAIRAHTGITLSALEVTQLEAYVQQIGAEEIGCAAPATPAGLVATAGNTQVSLAWTAVAGASSYAVKRGTASAGPFTPIASNLTATTYTDTGLVNGTPVFYVVAASTCFGAGNDSAAVQATPVAPPANVTTAYEAEVGTRAGGARVQNASNASGGKVVGNMNATNDAVTFNNVNGGTGGTCQVAVRFSNGQTSTNKLSLYVGGVYSQKITGAPTGGWNTFATLAPLSVTLAAGSVNAVKIQRLSGDKPLDLDKIDVTCGGSSGCAATTAPAAPTGLTETAGNAQAVLSWTAVTGATSYTLKRSTVSGSGYTVLTTVTGTSYTNTGLTNGTPYYYVVAATNCFGTGADSAQVAVTPTSCALTAVPAAPTGLAAAAGNAQSALSWTAVTGATSYTLKRSTVSGSGYAVVATVTGTSYTNTGLNNGTPYYYVVAATNCFGTGADSTQVAVTPTACAPTAGPAAPTGLTATVGDAQAILSWTAVTGATSYTLKRSTVSGSGYAVVTTLTGTSYTNTGLTNGTPYYYVVAAVNCFGAGADSAQVAVTPVAGTVPTPLVRLNFNENTGTSVANTGTVGGNMTRTSPTPAWTTNVPASGGTSSLDFGTTVGNVGVDSAGAISALGGLTKFTISGWVNNRNATEGSGGNRIVTWINNGGNGVDLVFKTDGSLQLGINQWPDGTTPPRSSAAKVSTDATAAAGNWRFFAVRYDSSLSTNHVQFYFGSTTADATLDSSRVYARGAVGTSIGPLTIGHFNTLTRAAATDRMFRGLIDKVQIHGAALTAAEIVQVQRQ